MVNRTARVGGGLLGLVALGIVLVLMGVPFVGMAIMMSMMVGREMVRGIALAVGTLFVVYLVSDFSGAFIAAAGSGVMAASILTGRDYRRSVCMASAAAALAAILGTLLLPQHSLLSNENVRALVQLYGSAGMSSSEIMMVIDILVYVVPSLLAVWAVTGTVAAATAARLMVRRRGAWPEVDEGEGLRLGLLPAWILIAALALNLLGGVPPQARQAAVNVAIFMMLPYAAVGIAICRKLLLCYPQMFLAMMLLILFPPLALGVLVLSGILDTWLDLRKKIELSKERKDQ